MIIMSSKVTEYTLGEILWESVAATVSLVRRARFWEKVPLQVHQLACCPSYMCSMPTRKAACPRFTSPLQVPWCMPTLNVDEAKASATQEKNSCIFCHNFEEPI